MRTSFFVFFFFWAISVSAQNWQEAVVTKTDSTELQGEVKWRDEVSMSDFRFRNEQGKERIDVELVQKLDLGERVFVQIKLEQLEASPVFLAEDLGYGLYHANFKEIRCLCDNSFNMVEAYIVKTDKTYILRKQAFRDAFQKDTEFPEDLTPDADMSFFAYPEFYRSKRSQRP